MKKAKSVKSETKNKKGEKSQWQKVNEAHSPIVTETNHPEKELLEKSAKHTLNNKKTQPKQRTKQAEKPKAETDRMRWVKNSGYVYRFRFIVAKHKKTPRTFKVGSTKLYYAKSLEHLADRIASIPYIEAIVGDIEKFNEKTQKWEVIEEFN